MKTAVSLHVTFITNIKLEISNLRLNVKRVFLNLTCSWKVLKKF